MAKKAYLLTFHATTRVVVDSDKDAFTDDELFAKMCEMARKKMAMQLDSYLCFDNAELEEDTEIPYKPSYDDKYKDTFVKD